MLKTAPVRKKEQKIVTISRLVHNKPIAIAIRAFAQIADRFPDLTYEIYGVGPDRESLSALIDSLDLQSRVFLSGYTNNPLHQFEKAQLSINLTKFEGYGLSILESLGMSCPVITSAVKYGPSELIQDGENGHLVNNDDIEGIASAIADILENIEKYQMNCLPSITDKSLGVWELKLLEIIDEAMGSKEINF